jgi:hypothetical protein
MTPDADPMADMFAAVAKAEAEGLAAHRAGECMASEWACAYCEAENDPTDELGRLWWECCNDTYAEQAEDAAPVVSDS